MPVKLKNVVAARLVSAEFDAKDSANFLDISNGGNTLKMSMCFLTNDAPNYDASSNVITLDIVMPPGGYSFLQFKTELETQMNSGFIGFSGNNGNFVTTTISIDSSYHLNFDFVPTTISSEFYGIRFKVHTASEFSSAAYEDSLAFQLGFPYDNDDIATEYLLDQSDFSVQGTQPVGSINFVDITTGVNDFMRFGVALTSGTSITNLNLFLADVIIPPGRYETSVLLKEIETQLNSLRIFDNAQNPPQYVSGGYDNSAINYQGSIRNYGKIVFRTVIDFDNNKISFEFQENMSYLFDTVYTKVYTGTDLYPTQADFDSSLPALLGFTYKPLEDNSTIYDETLYQTSYDIYDRYGTINTDTVPLVSFSPFTNNISNQNDIEIVDGKNSFQMGLGFMYGSEVALSPGNVWLSVISVQPGLYNIEELAEFVQNSINSIRRYGSSTIVQSNYVSGGYDFNLSSFGYGDLGSMTCEVVFDPTSRKFRFNFTEEFINFPPGDVSNVYVGMYAGIDEYATEADYIDSLPYLLGIPYDPSLSTISERYNPQFYQNNVITPGAAWYYESGEIQYSYTPGLTTPITLTLGYAEPSSTPNPVMLKITRNVTKRGYTFGEIKTIIENMFNSNVKYTTSSLRVIDSATSGLNRILNDSANKVFGNVDYDEGSQIVTLTLRTYLNESMFGQRYGLVYFKFHTGTDLFADQAAFDESIAAALGFEFNPADDGSVFVENRYSPILTSYTATDAELYDFSVSSPAVYLSVKELDETRLTGDAENRNNTNEIFTKVLVKDTSQTTFEPRHLDTVTYNPPVDYLDKLSIKWFQISPNNVHDKFTENMDDREHTFTIEFDVESDCATALYDTNFIRTARM